jgi:hypothetical protein
MDPGVFEALLRAPGDAGDYRLRFVAVDLAGREAFSEPVGASFAVPAGGFSFPGGWPLAVALLLATSGVVLAARAFFGRRPQTVERPSGEQPAPRPPIAPAGPPRVAEGARPADGRTTGSPPRRLRVFLCHSSTDKPQVRTVYGWLEGLQADPWLDHEKILPGQDWEREITVAVTASDAVLVCLSRESVSKTGYLQRELRFALDVAEQQPEGALFLIPVKLEECQPPIRLRHLHWVNLFEARGYDHLLAALQARADALGVPFGRTATSVAGSDPAP